jgi:hypothetical protein
MPKPKPMSTCTYPQQITAPITANPAMRLVRRIKQQFLPTHARVRYDAQAKRWAVLGPDNQPLRHFTHGHIRNVTLTVAETKGKPVGCGGATVTKIGIAEGDLVENAHAPDVIGMRNLSFHNGFRDESGRAISRADVIALLPNRRATFK